MAAAMGNQYALDNEGGRPLKYSKPEEMQIAIDQYFENCEGTLYVDKDTGDPVLSKYGEPIIIGAKPPTITGMALHLGFISRMSMLQYGAREEFIATVSQAKARVEAYTEARLFDRDGVNGAKFSLTNNFKGWKDTQSVEYTGPNGGPLLIQAVNAYSDDDLKAMEEIMARSQISGEIVDI